MCASWRRWASALHQVLKYHLLLPLLQLSWVLFFWVKVWLFLACWPCCSAFLLVVGLFGCLSAWLVWWSVEMLPVASFCLLGLLFGCVLAGGLLRQVCAAHAAVPWGWHAQQQQWGSSVQGF
jgi:hypothetical protein